MLGHCGLNTRDQEQWLLWRREIERGYWPHLEMMASENLRQSRHSSIAQILALFKVALAISEQAQLAILQPFWCRLGQDNQLGYSIFQPKFVLRNRLKFS
jgi:hypothetical protein